MNGLAQFECVAEGNPPPSVFWSKEGSQVSLKSVGGWERICFVLHFQYYLHGLNGCRSFAYLTKGTSRKPFVKTYRMS